MQLPACGRPGAEDPMKKRPKMPEVPQERAHTIRQEIMTLLEDRTLTARDISTELGIPEKQVCDHLTHIQKTMGRKERHLGVEPAVCVKCGFIFKKRDRLSRPGKCPICHGQQISPPLFSITPSE